MMPVGPLMIEHRLIEKMLKNMLREVDRIEKDKKVDVRFIDLSVDFIRTYADRCHHGKEEDILFRELKKKKLAPEHEKIMNELIQDHVFARGEVKKLVAANELYAQGQKEKAGEIVSLIRGLAEFYPKHIKKEDKGFFIPVMDYFSRVEQDAMIAEGNEFDRKLIHEKYQKLVQELSS